MIRTERGTASTVFLALALVAPGALLGAVAAFSSLFPISWFMRALRLHPPSDAKVGVVLLGLIVGAIALPVLAVRSRVAGRRARP